MKDKEENFLSNIDNLSSLADSVLEEGAEAVFTELPETYSNDNYTFDKEVAQGGLKLIYRMKDKKTGRYIALAKLKPEFRTPSHLERFLREAQTLAKLEHPNIVPLYEINYDKERIPFFTMKLLSGETLATILKNIRSTKVTSEGHDKKSINYPEQFPTEKLLGIFTRICDAVAFAHSKSIVHLDLKPENVQVSDYGEVLLLDWGFAKTVGEDIDAIEGLNEVNTYTPIAHNITRIGTINGTPGYMSPEQATTHSAKDNESNFATKEAYSQASDIYSLGAILYSIVTFMRPYKGLSIGETLERTRTGVMPDFPDAPAIPSALKAIISKAMAFNKKDRYNSAEDLKNDVQSYLHGFATKAEVPGILTLLNLFYKRHKKIISISTSFLLLISLISFISLSQLEEQRLIALENKQDAAASKKELSGYIIKHNATLSEIADGAELKEYNLRQNLEFNKIPLLYDKLISLGYETPEIWYRKAIYHAGAFELKESLDALEKIAEDKSSSLLESYAPDKLLQATRKYYNLSLKRPLSNKEIIQYSLDHEHRDAQIHTVWKINKNPDISTDQKIDQLRSSLTLFNPNITAKNINLNYKTNGNQVELDLSNNHEIFNIIPVIGLPLIKLDLSKCTAINYEYIYPFLARDVPQINISGTKLNISQQYLRWNLSTHLTARNISFNAEAIPNIKHLDLQGSTFKITQFHNSSKLEFLNIAHTNYQALNHLVGFENLKTLVLDKSQNIGKDTLRIFKERGVEIIIKE